jgi:hypothetical protein
MTTPAASRHFHWLPTTRPGGWALALQLLFLVLVPLNLVIEGAGQLAAWAGLLGGALAAFAVMRRGESALLVFAALLPALFVLGFEGAELLFPPY